MATQLVTSGGRLLNVLLECVASGALLACVGYLTGCAMRSHDATLWSACLAYQGLLSGPLRLLAELQQCPKLVLDSTFLTLAVFLLVPTAMLCAVYFVSLLGCLSIAGALVETVARVEHWTSEPRTACDVIILCGGFSVGQVMNLSPFSCTRHTLAIVLSGGLATGLLVEWPWRVASGGDYAADMLGRVMTHSAIAVIGGLFLLVGLAFPRIVSRHVMSRALSQNAPVMSQKSAGADEGLDPPAGGPGQEGERGR